MHVYHQIVRVKAVALKVYGGKRNFHFFDEKRCFHGSNVLGVAVDIDVEVPRRLRQVFLRARNDCAHRHFAYLHGLSHCILLYLQIIGIVDQITIRVVRLAPVPNELRVSQLVCHRHWVDSRPQRYLRRRCVGAWRLRSHRLINPVASECRHYGKYCHENRRYAKYPINVSFHCTYPPANQIVFLFL